MKQEPENNVDGADGSSSRRTAKRMVECKCKQDEVREYFIADSDGKIVAESDQEKTVWQKLLNEKNAGTIDTTCVKVEPCEMIGNDEILTALRTMDKDRAAGRTGVVAEMIMADEDLGVEWLTDLCNLIVAEGRIPDDWKYSVLMPVSEGKGESMECGSHRAVKLLEHAMIVIEHVFERRIRENVKVDDMQFAFRPGNGTADAVFALRQIQEKYRSKGRKLYYASVDLETAFDTVPREVIRWALRKAGVEEWLMNAVMAMYKGTQTEIMIMEGKVVKFKANARLHQGSVLSYLLFVIVLEVITKKLRVGLPWELLDGVNLMLVADSEENLGEKIRRWKSEMESNGLMNISEPKEMCCYLGEMLDADASCDSAVTARIRCAWKKFRKYVHMLSGKGFSLELKGKLYSSCVRSCLIYGSDTWPMKEEHVKKFERNDTNMIRWMCGFPSRDSKTNAELLLEMGLEPVSLVIQKGRLRWLGRVERKDDADRVKQCMMMEVKGTRPQGGQCKTWLQCAKKDRESLDLTGHDPQDRIEWDNRVNATTINPCSLSH